jgi:hypothetical protein
LGLGAAGDSEDNQELLYHFCGAFPAKMGRRHVKSDVDGHLWLKHLLVRLQEFDVKYFPWSRWAGRPDSTSGISIAGDIFNPVSGHPRALQPTRRFPSGFTVAFTSKRLFSWSANTGIHSTIQSIVKEAQNEVVKSNPALNYNPSNFCFFGNVKAPVNDPTFVVVAGCNRSDRVNKLIY